MYILPAARIFNSLQDTGNGGERELVCRTAMVTAPAATVAAVAATARSDEDGFKRQIESCYGVATRMVPSAHMHSTPEPASTASAPPSNVKVRRS